jgi:hypothetical protein
MSRLEQQNYTSSSQGDFKIKEGAEYPSSSVKFFGYFILFVLLISLIFAINATGLVKLPLIKDIVYRQEPVPTRKVEIVSVPQGDLLERINNFREQGRDELKISEKDLTKAVRWEWVSLPVEEPQVVVLPEGLELFTKILRPRPFYLTVKARFQPLTGGAWSVKLKSFKVGHLPLPSFVAKVFSVVFVEKFFNKYLAAAGILKDIKFYDGYLVLIK